MSSTLGHGQSTGLETQTSVSGHKYWAHGTARYGYRSSTATCFEEVLTGVRLGSPLRVGRWSTLLLLLTRVSTMPKHLLEELELTPCER